MRFYFGLLVLLFSLPVLGVSSYLRLETGAAQSTRNYFKLPRDTGTRVDLPNESSLAYRFEGSWSYSDKNAIRWVVAPLKIKSRILSTSSVTFDKTVFPAGNPIDIEFTFNSYRFGYVRQIYKSDELMFDLGVTLKVRDAAIQLLQSATVEKYTNMGFVPLIYLALNWDFATDWRWQTNMDALGASQGYAIDFMTEINRSIDESWRLGLSYRFLDGGADNDKVENFATVHYLTVAASYEF